MDVAIISRKKTRSVINLQKAFKKRGFAKATFMKAQSVTLVSKGKKTFITDNQNNLSDFDAALILLDPGLTPFVEPVLDELELEDIFANVKPGSYYVTHNEFLQFSELAIGGCKTTPSICASNVESLKVHLSSITYPVIFKSYIKGNKNQAIIVESHRSLLSLLNSIKVAIDGIIVKEFQEADVLVCAVIGEKVFGVRRRWNGTELTSSSKARPIILSDAEKEQAKLAARVCGCQIATVKIAQGLVNRVLPTIDFALFRNKLGIDLEDEIALFYQYSLEGKPVPRPKQKTILDHIKNGLEGFFYG
jgi:hypothetical protein